MSQGLVGVILAAGEGRRMGSLGARLPKTCLPICNRPLILRHIDLLSSIGIREVVVVVGFEGDQVAALVSRGAPDMRVRYIEQPERRGIAHALHLTRDLVSGTVVVLLGDTYFIPDDPMSAVRALSQPGPPVAGVLSIRREPDPDRIRRECSVRFDSTGALIQIREKPLVPFNDLKPCGLYFFVSDRIFGAIERTPPSALRGEIELTDAIQRLVDDGQRVVGAPTIRWDVNLNVPEDLLFANIADLRRRGLSRLVADGAVVHPAAALHHVVVGERARVEAAVRLENIVLLPGAVVGDARALANAVVGEDAVEVVRVSPERLAAGLEGIDDGPTGGGLAGDSGGDRPVTFPLPRELYLEVTNRCNLKCRTCPQHFGMPEPSADMSFEQVRRLVDQFPRLDRVVLHGIGESMLHPRLPEIVQLLKGRGAYVLFNTNGTVSKPAVIEALVTSGLDELRVSIDSATPDTYEDVRGANSWSLVVENIRSIKRVKERLGHDRPRLSLWMTGLSVNVGELPDLVRLAADLGIVEVYLQRLVTSERGLARRSLSLVGRPAERSAAVGEAEALARELGIALRGSNNACTAADLGASNGQSEQAPWRRCQRPWTLTYVTANVNVLPCCIAPFTSTDYAGIVLGNAFEAPLPAIWSGDAYERWRREMVSGPPPPACARCGVDWPL